MLTTIKLGSRKAHLVREMRVTASVFLQNSLIFARDVFRGCLIIAHLDHRRKVFYLSIELVQEVYPSNLVQTTVVCVDIC